jgi:hypothetical protein
VRRNMELAMDALPLTVTQPNSALPALLTTMVDPDVFRIMFAPLKAAEMMGGEQRKGNWLLDTELFPVVEATGEVSSYGDYNPNGRAGVNTNWPARQNYLFQVVKEYGEREMERAGLARINWVGEIDTAAALTLNTFLNYSYFFGVAGLMNYGLLNEPNLSAALTPATKAAGGVKWVNGSQIVATANEVYNDIQSLYVQLVIQTGGLVDQSATMVLALGTVAATALTATNSFGVSVTDLLKKNFPNMTVVTAVNYNVQGVGNPQGIAAGNTAQLMVSEIQGQNVGYPAYSEKMRAHAVVTYESSWRQKNTAGTWGTVLRFPAGISQMVGL